MSLLPLLRFQNLGIEITVCGDSFYLEAAEGVITNELIRETRAEKATLLAYLKERYHPGVRYQAPAHWEPLPVPPDLELTYPWAGLVRIGDEEVLVADMQDLSDGAPFLVLQAPRRRATTVAGGWVGPTGHAKKGGRAGRLTAGSVHPPAALSG